MDRPHRLLVGGVGRRPGAGDLDAAFDGVVDLLLAGQAHAHPHGSDDLQPGVEGVDRDVEADLVVALAGAAVGDRVRALPVGDLDQQLRDERPRQRGGQGVDALVPGIRLEAGEHEVAHEALTPVHDVCAGGARASARGPRCRP